jgi:hypothetical protein
MGKGEPMSITTGETSHIPQIKKPPRMARNSVHTWPHHLPQVVPKLPSPRDLRNLEVTSRLEALEPHFKAEAPFDRNAAGEGRDQPAVNLSRRWCFRAASVLIFYLD